MSIQMMLLGVGSAVAQNYSVDFDGTGDFLSMATSSDLSFGTGDYTVECWIKPTSLTSTLEIVLNAGGSSLTTFFFHYDSDQLSVGNQMAYISNQSTTFSNNTWYHIAACRSGSTLKLFKNGTQVGSDATDNINWASGGPILIGCQNGPQQLVNGKISNLRVVKGQALYTSNFTVTTSPLTTTSQSATASNVKLLCCNDSSASGSTVTPGTITVNGDTTSSTDNPF